MAYILSDLITEVQRKAKDSSFDSTLITDYINDIQDEVLGSRLFSFMETSISTTLNIDDTSYTYPAALQVIVGIRLTEPTDATIFYDLEYLPHRQFFDRFPTPTAYEASTPTAYTDFGRTLLFDRPLDKAYPLYLRYIKRPTALSDGSDVPAIPQEYKQIIIRGALASVEEYRDNFDIGAVHRRKVEDLVEALVARYTPRQLHSLHRATSARIRKV